MPTCYPDTSGTHSYAGSAYGYTADQHYGATGDDPTNAAGDTSAQ